jgi:hypothetical protein
MQDSWDAPRRKNLEDFLHDLICTVGSPQEVGILVEVLMAMQVSEPGTAAVTTKAARALN